VASADTVVARVVAQAEAVEIMAEAPLATVPAGTPHVETVAITTTSRETSVCTMANTDTRLAECKKKKCDEDLHATQVDEEEEPTLLLDSAKISGRTDAIEHLAVHLDEGRLFVLLGDWEHVDNTRWILDSSATNNMISVRSVFTEIDHKVQGTVRFRDGAVADIEGHGTILLKCKIHERMVPPGVYLIPRLTVNIVSLRQLEEDTHKIVIHAGFLMIWDKVGHLMAKVQRASNWLYVLRLNVDRPMCLGCRETFCRVGGMLDMAT
jgi:hypothetical protein